MRTQKNAFYVPLELAVEVNKRIEVIDSTASLHERANHLLEKPLYQLQIVIIT